MSAFSRTTSLTLGTALIAAPFALSAVAANAVPASSCGGVTGAVEVLTNVCEIGFQSAADAGTTFSTPSGMTKMAAVLVGAGGGSEWAGGAYGGGGGGVEYVDLSSAAGATFTVTPGLGGDAAADGEHTTLSWGTETATATGGFAPSVNHFSAYSGNSGGAGLGVDGSQYGASGGGASGDGIALSDYGQFEQGGAGLTPSELPGVSTALFQTGVNDFEFGVGGSASNELNTQTTFSTNATYALAGYGGNALDGTSESGNDGAVYIRWTTVADPTPTPTPELAHTGANTATPIALGLGSVALGSVIVANGLRVRSRRTK